MTRCFDFPEVVIHDPSGQCPRYTGGLCFPEPRPNPAKDEVQIRAVKSYQAFRKAMAGDRDALGEVETIKAKGQAIDPQTGEVISSQDPTKVLPFPVKPSKES